MTDRRQCSREFLTEFIEIYKNLPCLWQSKSKKRDIQNQAYEILVQKYKEIDATANRETVVKKIHSLRSVHHKELAKINKTIRSGAEENDIYKPTVWYFDLFSFLNDEETPREFMNTMDDEPAIFLEGGQEPEDDTNQSYIDIEPVKTPDTPATLATPGSSTSSYISGSTSCNTSHPQFSSLKRKRPPYDDKTIEIMSLIGKRIDSLKPDDSSDIFGKHVANKLRILNNQQNMFAQKLINDVLFEAEMASLTESYKVVDLRKPQSHFGSTGNYYEWQQPIPQQIEQYQNISQQIREQQPIPQQIGQYQPSHVDYFTNFENNNAQYK